MSVFVFDGDDTLWSVEHAYSKAYADFFSFLYKVLGQHVPNLHFVYNVFFHLEGRNSKHYGVQRGRVAKSMVETYWQVCEWVKEYRGLDVYRKEDEDAIRVIGDQPFDVREHRWMDGAEEVLDSVLSHGHMPCLLTKYDHAVWPRKAKVLNTSRFFKPQHIRVIQGAKQMHDFAALANAVSGVAAPYYTVGNSKDDMHPVHEDEMWRGFHIPLPSTVPLEGDTRPSSKSFVPDFDDHPRVEKLKRIKELLTYI